tara:strand:- start:170 stop:454 length:285 start_codon:yes stop_codon:yes gene_type:complete
MAKLDWEKRSKYDKIDHYAEAVERNKPKQKQIPSYINLGKHENHNWVPIIKATGPHGGKVVCVTCGNKFVTWLPKSFTKSAIAEHCEYTGKRRH